MREALAVTKALADESRLRVICALRGRELCVCQIVELLGLAPSTVSKHMWILRQARLAESRKEERWIYYRLCGQDAPKVAREAVEWVWRSLRRARQIQKDARNLGRILRIDPVELCKRQAGG